MWIRSLCRAVVGAGLVVAVAVVLGATAGSALAATTTTITFDDFPAGTTVSNQYEPQGVVFVTGIVGLNVYCFPKIEAVPPGDAESGDQVADTSCANGEFPDSSIRGDFSASAQHVSVFVGYSPPAGTTSTTTVTLTAYDVNGNVVDSTLATVSPNTGTHQFLEVGSGTADITSFDVTADAPDVSIDNLTFDNPAGVPADFAISPQSAFVQVAQGSGVPDLVTIQRLNGSTGPITFSASGAPTGVQVSFSPNPATGDSTTMTVTADPTAPVQEAGAFPTITITGTPPPADPAVGSVPRSATAQVDVQQLFRIETPQPLSVPPCSTLRVPITINTAAGFTGTATLALAGLPADDQASFDPSTITSAGQTQSVLTLTSQSDISGPAGFATVTATTSSGVSDASGTFTVTRVPPSITSLTDSSGTQQLHGGQTPQGASPDLGTIVIIHGQGFCPGSSVYFGNAQASATTQGPAPDGLGPFGDETILRTSVPSLATSGNVYVVPAGESLTSPGTATTPFTVDSYRDVNGFPFTNSSQFQSRVGGYSFSDVSDVFGAAATHIDINPCWPFGDCTIVSSIPDPFALLFWGIADAALQDGQCFGFSLATQRFLHGDEFVPAFPFEPGVGEASVWDLVGPDGPDGTSGASGSLAHYIHLTHMEQLSAQALNFWLGQAVSNAVSGSQSSIMNDVTSALDAGDHPLVEIRDGTQGHVVVAYGVDQANGNTHVGFGDRVIDVYNPNQPFTTGENAIDGSAHEATLSTSEIVVHPDGHWEFQGDFSPEYSGGPGSIVVMPYGVVPVQPTLPTSLSGLVDLLFGSAGASQVSDSHGHTLLNSDGSLNTDPATGIADATQFATLSGTAAPGPGIFLFAHPGAYTTTVHGQARGQYHDVLLAHGMAASVTAGTAPGLADGISVPANLDGLQFGQTKGTSSDPRQADAQITVDGSQGSQLTAAIATTMPTSGETGFGFNAARDAVEVTASRKPATVTLSLSWTSPAGLPQSFVAPSVHLAAGDRGTLTPANWSSLQSSHVTLRVVHRNGTITTRSLQNRIRPAGSFKVTLAIAKAHSTRRLTISTHLFRLPAGSSAVATWQVLRGRAVVARHTVVLSGAKLHPGLVRLTFPFKGAASARYTFRAAVELLSPTRSGTYLSQQAIRVERFRG